MESLGKLNQSYSGLFEIEDSREDDGSRRNTSGGNEGFSERWGWWITLDNLSNGCFEKWEYYETMNVIQFLNTCAYVKDKQKMLEWENRKK